MKEKAELNEEERSRKANGGWGEFHFTPTKGFMESLRNYQKKHRVKECPNAEFLFSYRKIDAIIIKRLLELGKPGFVVLSIRCDEGVLNSPTNSLDQLGKELTKTVRAAHFTYSPLFRENIEDQFHPLYSSLVLYNTTYKRGITSLKDRLERPDFDGLHQFSLETSRKYGLDITCFTKEDVASCLAADYGGKVSLSMETILKPGLYARKCLTYEYVDRMRRTFLGEDFLAFGQERHPDIDPDAFSCIP